MILSHDTLANYYQMNQQLKMHHNWNIDELENRMPFEREIYVALLVNYLEQEKQRNKS